MEIDQLKCIIADDEKPAREILEKHVQKIPYLKLTGQCANAMDALIQIRAQKPDLVFLDIQMPGLSGMELISLLPEPRPKIIIVTGDPQFAIEGFNSQVTDYILKPISFERFARAVLKAYGELRHQVSGQSEPQPETKYANNQKINVEEDDYLLVRDSKRLVRIDIEKIQVVEAMKDYLKIYWSNGVTVLHQTMTRIEEKLPGQVFLRVHRSFIVSRKIIAEINGSEMILTTGKVIPIGSTYRDNILRGLGDNIL
ncbi:LytTR family DNA-binding domain-containing protein [Dyadobacter sp. Leaf189]|uniref:LytR/AlgR family response regulator transcription factor n=1 Tax=Dyadobacter sp. Leaf189 TaxID=1736295 RepID=UPI0006F54D56|nr:response regulator [Dyadobacter sp. Leaf189]KQS27882.1 hypothetical protein ASG33_15830 [Dyadobacter sp. Leaf189]